MCIACALRGNAVSWTSFDHLSTGGHQNGSAGTSFDRAAMSSTGATGNSYIDALIQGSRWIGAITYSFPDSRTDYEASYPEADAAGFGQVSFAHMQAARSVLEGFSPYTGGPRMSLTAVEGFTNAVLSDAGSNTADIRIAKSSYAGPTAYAYYPAPNNGYFAGDVWFGTSYGYSNARLGNYEYLTMMHELGHSLGLKHAHEAGGVANMAMPSDRDSLEFTVMSYRSYIGGPATGYTNETYGFPQTWMMYDIAALQHLYGANFSTNSGDTVYSWSPTTGETFVNGVGQGAPGGGTGGPANKIFLTIWDGGGADTYDFSNYSTNLSVDLRPGQWSATSQDQRAYLGSGQYANGNVYNALQYNGAPRSLIENARGGSGHDIIIGNAANNVLTGNGGNDWLDGSLGIDTAVFNFNFSSATVGYGHAGHLVSGPEGQDTLRWIEHLSFSDGRIELNDGNALVDDVFYYGRNKDVWNARADADQHYAASGWREHRDPNGLFSTAGYLSANKDVRSAQINPLDQYHQSGWREGRDPSANFDTQYYLTFNPDVKAAGFDPLEHYLASGIYEGRSTHAAIGRMIQSGFDAEFYLLSNPDVGIAGVDAFSHYSTSGWKEGRDPNAYFDTDAYLATYADVAAAGINPLTHYLQMGWREGRDPCAGFDTSSYLAAYGDVAASGTDPLQHYLRYGLYEGRSSFSDGVIG